MYKGSVTTTTIATLKTSTGKTKRLYILLDTGSSNTILSNNYLEHVKSIKKSKSEYATAGGLFTTSKQGTLVFKLPEFSNSKDITWSMDMDNGKLEELGYDMIIGRDLLFSLGDTGKCTHFPYLMFSILKINSDHIFEKINLISIFYFI